MALSSEQQRVLNAFLAEARRQGASPKELKALVEAGLVESGLRNLHYGDRDSVGALQQRPSQGWRNAMNPAAAARDFLTQARAANRQGMSAGQLAQAVQRSAFPGRYDEQGGQAEALLGGRASAASAASSSRTTTRTIPGVDRSRERGALIAQFLQDKHANPVDLALGVRALQDTPSRTVTTSSPSPSPAAPTGKGGVVDFAGKPVASWIAKELNWARAHGWTGSVTSGYRSVAEQARIYNSGVRPAAKPGQSNHNFTAFPGGAVDVTDAQQLAQILARKPGGSLLQWAGAKDPVHFSHPHGGGY